MTGNLRSVITLQFGNLAHEVLVAVNNSLNMELLREFSSIIFLEIHLQANHKTLKPFKCTHKTPFLVTTNLI